MAITRNRLFKICSALIAGLCLPIAFAPYEVFPLAVIAPSILLATICGENRSFSFLLGFIFGCAFFGVGVSWVFHSIHDIGLVSTPISVIITAGFVVILALFPAIAALLTAYFKYETSTKYCLAFPMIWVASEFFRSNIASGFPWLLLGYSQTNSPLKGFAPIFGVYGISLAIVMMSGLLFSAIQHYRRHKFRALYFELLAIGSIWTIGALLTLIPWTQPVGKPIAISLVQGNIPQEIKWSPDHLDKSVNRYATLTAPLWNAKPTVRQQPTRLIIWPEAAIPLPLPEAAKYIDLLDTKAKDTNTQLILGIPISINNQMQWTNSVISLGQQKNNVYSKQHLVPFGEYNPAIPFAALAFNFLNIPISETLPGKRHQLPFKLNLGEGDISVPISICYEIAFPELIDTRDPNTHFLLTVTNDGWFGRSNAQAQHFQIAIMRAIELARPVVMVSNDGLTGVIGPTGKVEAIARPYEATVLNTEVQGVNGLTPWMNNGTNTIWIILLILLFFAIRQEKIQSKIKTEVNHST